MKIKISTASSGVLKTVFAKANTSKGGRNASDRQCPLITKEHSVLGGDLISNSARGHTFRLSDAYGVGGIFVPFLVKSADVISCSIP